jgi:hypothetical protein
MGLFAGALATVLVAVSATYVVRQQCRHRARQRREVQR